MTRHRTLGAAATIAALLIGGCDSSSVNAGNSSPTPSSTFNSSTTASTASATVLPVHAVKFTTIKSGIRVTVGTPDIDAVGVRTAAIEGFHSGYDRLKKTSHDDFDVVQVVVSAPLKGTPTKALVADSFMSDLAKIDDWDTAEQLQWTNYSEVTDFDPSLAPLNW